MIFDGGIRYIDIDDAQRLIDQEALGVVVDRGTLLGQLDRPRTWFGGVELYASMHEKAAVLLHGLATTQPLIDGNKRLAAASTVAFYRINGYSFEADPIDFARHIRVLAARGCPVDEIAMRLSSVAHDRLDSLAPDNDD